MADLSRLASSLTSKGPHRVEPTSRRVRILFNKVYVVDTTGARHVWEHPYFPQYYIPHSALQESPHVSLTKGKALGGGAYEATLKVGQKSTDRVVVFEGKGELEGLVRFEFSAMDAWYEEDLEIFIHPKDPYKRIDILHSTRRIRVEVDGQTIAESPSSMHLLETGLPTRYYLPKTSVRWDFVQESGTTSGCPYKGEANYYNIILPPSSSSPSSSSSSNNPTTYRDAIWYYRSPTAESIAIAGCVCFYNEKVDLFLDGVKMERPKSKFG